MSRTEWTCALELDDRRRVVSGSSAQLAAAVGRAADLRILTESATTNTLMWRRAMMSWFEKSPS
jgi:hypothetical protein